MTEILQTLAEIAIALAGFSGVAIAFGGGIKGLPSVRLSLLLSLSGEVVLFSLIPMLLLVRLDESQSWVLAGAIYGLVHLVHIGRSIFGYSSEKTGIKRPRLDQLLMAIGALLSASLLYVVLTGSTPDIQIVYGTLLVFVLSVAGSQFYRLLMVLQRHRLASDA
jgi:hypothetical protein